MKQKRYWLRGGLTVMVLVIVLTVVMYLKLSVSFPFTGHGGEAPGVPGVTSALVTGYIMLGVPVLAIAFGFGALIGGIYGKIKNRNKV